MEGLQELSATELLAGRPFTAPEMSARDLEVLQHMLVTLCNIVCDQNDLPAEPRPLVLWLTEKNGGWHRVAICDDVAIRERNDYTIVGFFGQKKLDIDRRPIDDVDEKLIKEFPEHPELLSYSTMQQTDGNSCNLVLFRSPDSLPDTFCAGHVKGDRDGQMLI